MSGFRESRLPPVTKPLIKVQKAGYFLGNSKKQKKMYILEQYSRKEIKTLWKKEFKSLEEVLSYIDKFLKEASLKVVAKEHFDSANWWYLDDGTEIDFCIV